MVDPIYSRDSDSIPLPFLLFAVYCFAILFRVVFLTVYILAPTALLPFVIPADKDVADLDYRDSVNGLLNSRAISRIISCWDI